MKRELKAKQKSRVVRIAFIGVFSILGVGSILATLAASTTSTFEAESGSRTGSVNRIDNVTTASGGAYIQFGSEQVASGTFRVVGGDIIDPDGNKFVPIGANVGPMVHPFGCYAFAASCMTAEGHSDDALEWGWNMVRANITILHGRYDSTRDVNIQDNITAVQRLIDEYTAKKIVVMPTVHYNFDCCMNAPMTHPMYGDINAFWDAIIDRNRNNPYVWINYLNEPIWSPYKTGIDTNSATNDDNVTFWKTLGDQHYQRVRQRTNNVFVYDLPVWAQQINELANHNTGEEFLQGKQNVVFAWHNYGGAIKYDQGWRHPTYEDMSQWAQMVKDKDLPVIIGEFGRASTVDPQDVLGQEHVVATDWVFDNWWQYGFGGLWWHGTGVPDNWDLRFATNEGGKAWYDDRFPLTEAGQRLRAIPSQKPANY